MRKTLDKEIESMLRMEIIEPSTAAYASPVVMVKNLTEVLVSVLIAEN